MFAAGHTFSLLTLVLLLFVGVLLYLKEPMGAFCFSCIASQAAFFWGRTVERHHAALLQKRESK